MEVKKVTLFEKMGGKEKLEEALHIFHGHLMKDEEMKPFFLERDMEKHLQQQLNFIARIAGGPSSCTCKCGHGNHSQKVMEKSHKDLSINVPQFDRFMDLLVLSLYETGIPVDAIDALSKKLLDLKEYIITVK